MLSLLAALNEKASYIMHHLEIGGDTRGNTTDTQTSRLQNGLKDPE